jgi:hypothetical protein
MDKMMAMYKDVFVNARLPRTLSKLLRRAGFDIHDRDEFTILNWSFDADTFSGHLIDFLRALAQNHHVFSSRELDDWLQSIQIAAEADEYFFSLNRYIFSAVPTRDPARLGQQTGTG